MRHPGILPHRRLADPAALPAERVDLVIGAAGVHGAAGHREPRLHRTAGGEIPDHRAVAGVQRVDLAVVAARVHAATPTASPDCTGPVELRNLIATTPHWLIGKPIADLTDFSTASS